MPDPTTHTTIDTGGGAYVAGSVQAQTFIGRDLNVHLPDRAPIDDAAAQALIATLPTDAVPPVSALPAGSVLPWPPNPHFVGRDDGLRALAAALRPARGCAVLHGLGGVGKSQLAAEFAQRYGQFFAGGVYWLSFADPDLVPTLLATFYALADMPAAGFMPLPAAARLAAVREGMSRALPRLLIFDNVGSDAAALRALGAWRPTAGGCRVLITSRRGDWPSTLGITPIALATLARPASRALLAALAPALPAADGDALAAALGDHPLALYLAGSYLADGGRDPARLLAELATKRLAQRALRGRGVESSPTDHELSVAATFALSRAQLAGDDARERLARILLAHLAWLAPGTPVDRPLLGLTLAARATWPPADIDADELNDELIDAERRAVNVGLVERAAGGLRLHRLVAALLQTADDPAGDPAADPAQAQRAVETGVTHAIHAGLAAGALPTLRDWLPHLAHVTHAALEALDRDTAGAADAAETGAAEEAADDDATRAASLANNLAALHEADGDYANAWPLYQRVLNQAVARYGQWHAATARAANNFGGLLLRMGDLEQAHKLLTAALTIRQQVLGDDHPHTADSLNNLANLYLEADEPAEALPLLTQALAISRAVNGEAHLETAQSMNNLAVALVELGQSARALPLLTQALAIRQAQLAADHPEIASTLNNRGRLRHLTGDLAGAADDFAASLAIKQRVLGAEHPGTATTLCNLALVQRAQGDLVAAAANMRRALAIRAAKLGAAHPDTQDAARSLLVIEAELAAGG